MSVDNWHEFCFVALFFIYKNINIEAEIGEILGTYQGLRFC